MACSPNFLIRWLLVCLIPSATVLYFYISPPSDQSQHLLNGIILVCEATFLCKFVLFETIKHHLRQEPELRKKMSLLFIPIALLVIYLFYYFGAFE